MKKTRTTNDKLKVRKERVRNLTDDMAKQARGGMSCLPGTENCGPFTRSKGDD